MKGLIARSFATVLVVAPLVLGCSKGPTKSEPATASAPTSAAASSTAVAPKGQTFGAGVTLADSVSIDTILAEPAAYKGKTVRVEGMVTDVCPKRGCWFEMAGGQPGAKLRFKVTDGDMVFPPDSKGKLAVAQGEVSVHELTLEQTKEYAEEQAKEYGKPYDPATITKPQAIVRIDGTGAVFRDKI